MKKCTFMGEYLCVNPKWACRVTTIAKIYNNIKISRKKSAQGPTRITQKLGIPAPKTDCFLNVHVPGYVFFVFPPWFINRFAKNKNSKFCFDLLLLPVKIELYQWREERERRHLSCWYWICGAKPARGLLVYWYFDNPVRGWSITFKMLWLLWTKKPCPNSWPISLNVWLLRMTHQIIYSRLPCWKGKKASHISVIWHHEKEKILTLFLHFSLSTKVIGCRMYCLWL